MKALSIKQPWASLIVEGIKDVENRTWRTNFRGRIYVHASSPTKFNVHLSDERTALSFGIIKQAIDGNLPFGAIIGEVDIIDCVQNHPSIWAEKHDLHFNDDKPKQTWNWLLANPARYDEPIFNVKGKLSFWDYLQI